MLHITLNRPYFSTILRTALKAIANVTTIPILTGIKIEVNAQGMKITSSNTDISLEIFTVLENKEANLKVHTMGAIVLNGKFFINVINSLSENLLTLEVMENNQVKILSGKAEFFINGLDTKNYPILPNIENENPIKIPVKLLTQLIKKTVFAISLQESRPILTGVHLSLADNKQLIAIATDSHRLSHREIKLPEMVENFDVIVPGKNLKEISSIFVNEEEIIEIHIHKNQLVFESENIRYYSRLLIGNYPETKQLIPSKFNTILIVRINSFLGAIERASLFSHKGQNNIVKLEITSKKVTLYSNSPEVGKAKEELEIESISGEPLTISFNPDYIKDALKAFNDNIVNIQFVSSIRPFILKQANIKDDFIQLITPVITR
ncbi:MAG: DNA polymerase III subunit beta [Streptococcaceae bacterium]|jgi:DNA polymerase-3 subunit beta|nr:DNA polymerase III subunit beta [Streptococcaceae bacterium]